MPVIKPWAKWWWREALLFLVVAGSHSVYAYHSVKVPYVFGDEAGYLLKAAALAGYVTDAYSSYYPAYALLIVPAFLGMDDPERVFHAVQFINALLAGAGALLMYGLARRWWPAVSPRRAWVAALVVSLYPPFMAFSSFALSENLFVPLVVALGLCVFRYASEPGRGRWAFGVLCGLLALAHPKGMVVDAAAGLAVLPAVWRGRRWRDALIVAVVALAVFVPPWLVLDAFFKWRLGTLDGHYPDAAGVLGGMARLADRHALAELAGRVLGQVFYLLAGSVGLAAIGLGLTWRRIFFRDDRGGGGTARFRGLCLAGRPGDRAHDGAVHARRRARRPDLLRALQRGRGGAVDAAGAG